MRKLKPVTPGELLLEEFLVPMGISQYRLAKEIGVPPQRIGEIVAGKRSITADTDLRLCRFLGLSNGGRPTDDQGGRSGTKHQRSRQEEQQTTRDRSTSHSKGRSARRAAASERQIAYQIIHDELMLDGNARLNLATFVTPGWSPGPAAHGRVLRQEHDRQGRVPADGRARDALRQHARPSLARARRRQATGCAPRQRGGHARRLALKRRWQQSAGRGKAATSPTSSWASTSRSAGRSSPTTGTSRCATCPWRETASTLRRRGCKRCDENTIGVVAVLGSTFDGSYEPVRRSAPPRRLQSKTGLDIRCTSTAPRAVRRPFIDEDLEWDFRLPRVASINASGHKYGLVYPGVGWIVWRDATALPEDLIFWVNYLGDNMPTFALNFSRPGARSWPVLQLPAPRLRRVSARAEVRARSSHAPLSRSPSSAVRATKGRELPVRLQVKTSTTTPFRRSTLRERGWLVPLHLPRTHRSTILKWQKAPSPRRLRRSSPGPGLPPELPGRRHQTFVALVRGR